MEERIRTGEPGSKGTAPVTEMHGNVIDLDPQRSQEVSGGEAEPWTAKDDTQLSDSEHRFYAWTIERLQRQLRWLALGTGTAVVALLVLVAVITTFLTSSVRQAEEAAADSDRRVDAAESALTDQQVVTAEMFGVGSPEAVPALIEGLADEIDELRRAGSRTRELTLERTRCVLTVLARQHQHFRSVARGNMSVAEYTRRISPEACRR